MSWTDIKEVFAESLLWAGTLMEWALCPHVPLVPQHECSRHGLGGNKVGMMASSVGKRFTGEG